MSAADVRLPPHSLEAERAVLGALMLLGTDPRPLLRRVRLRPEHYYREAHRHIWNAATQLAEAGRPVDPVTLQEPLRATGLLEAAGGLAYLAQLVDLVPSAANAEHYAEIVRSHARLRRLIAVGSEIVDVARSIPEDVAAFCRHALGRITAAATEDGAGPQVRTTQEGVMAYWKELHAAMDDDGRAGLITTGLASLDEAIGGWTRGLPHVVGARPGQGKSSLLVGAAIAAARAGVGVHVFSYEDTVEHWIARGLAQMSGLDAQPLVRMQPRRLAKDAWGALASAATELATLPIYYDALLHAHSDHVVEQMHAVHSAHPEVGLVLIDYVQKLYVRGWRGDARNYELERVSREVIAAGRETHVALVFAAQLNRDVEKRKTPQPTPANLRDCGDLEQSARVILMPWRPESYGIETITLGDGPTRRDIPSAGKTVIEIAKQTHGPAPMRVVADFDARSTAYRDRDRWSEIA